MPRVMAETVRVYIPKFGREVLIEKDHPLAVEAASSSETGGVVVPSPADATVSAEPAAPKRKGKK